MDAEIRHARPFGHLLQTFAVLSGVAVGGEFISFYANTLPIPKSEFYNSGHWNGLENWEETLKPFCDSKKMLGAETSP